MLLILNTFVYMRRKVCAISYVIEANSNPVAREAVTILAHAVDLSLLFKVWDPFTKDPSFFALLDFFTL